MYVPQPSRDVALSLFLTPFALSLVWEVDRIMGQRFDRGGADGLDGWDGPTVRAF